MVFSEEQKISAKYLLAQGNGILKIKKTDLGRARRPQPQPRLGPAPKLSQA